MKKNYLDENAVELILHYCCRLKSRYAIKEWLYGLISVDVVLITDPEYEYVCTWIDGCATVRKLVANCLEDCSLSGKEYYKKEDMITNALLAYYHTKESEVK